MSLPAPNYKNETMKVEITNHQLYDKCVHSIDYDLTWVNGIVEGRMTIIDTEGVDHHYEGIFTPTEFYKWGIKLTNDNCAHPWNKTESAWGGGTICRKCMKTI